MRKLIVFFLLVSCKTPEREWVSLIKNNSLDGWHIFQDNGSKTGWYVENEILIFDKISGLESGEDDSSLLSNKTYTSFEITSLLIFSPIITRGLLFVLIKQI